MKLIHQRQFKFRLRIDTSPLVRPRLFSISLRAKYCIITLYCQLFVFVMSPPVTLHPDQTTSFHNPPLSHHTHFYLSKSSFKLHPTFFWKYCEKGQLFSGAKDTNCQANVLTKRRIMNCAAREWMDEVSMDLVYQPPPSPLTSNVKL